MRLNQLFGVLFTAAVTVLHMSVAVYAQGNSNPSLLSQIFGEPEQSQSNQDTPPPTPSNNESARVAQASTSQSASAASRLAEEINSNTVTIVSGTPSGTWMYIAHDMSAVLDDGNNLRVLPILGKGSAQNIRDILYLKGIDIGIVQANILQHFNSTGEVGRNIEDRLRYITRLYDQEIHLLVRPEINSVEDLRGKRVNFANKGSGSQITARLLFEKLGIETQEFNMQVTDAFVKMEQNELDATFFSTGKPSNAFGKIDNVANLKFLSIPYEGAVTENFFPATFTHEDYPNLVPEGEVVNTIAESVVLVSFNWSADSERYRRVAKFTRALFENFDKLLEKPRHPKWKEVNLASELPGWERFGAAEEILKNIQPNATDQDNLRQEFNRFMSSSLSDSSIASLSETEREQLFRRFLEWRKTQ